jgi:hypothetical protein
LQPSAQCGGEYGQFGQQRFVVNVVKRLRMLMPPSRTRETCPRSHIPPPGW